MVKFLEDPENNEKKPLDQKIKDKFKFMSLKGAIDYDLSWQIVSILFQ